MEPPAMLRHILDGLLPILLVSSLSPASLPSRWRLLHPKLSRLHSLLSDPSAAAGPHHPLFLSLLPSLASTLAALVSLSDPAAPLRGKLLLQSDLDIASSLLSSHLHDLSLLSRSGLLHRRPHHSDASAIVLPLPGPASSRPDLALFVRDAFARIQIGALDLKHKALDSLLLLLASDPPTISILISQEGDVASLVRLLDLSNHSLIRDLAASVASVLATASDASRTAVFEEGGLGPLLRLLESGPAPAREAAATAIEAITADPANAWAVSAYGGVAVLVSACRSGGGSPSVQSLAAGSLKNVAAVEDLRAQMIEEGAVPVLIDLLASGSSPARKNVAICLWSLSSAGDDEVKAAIFQAGGLQSLVRLVCESSDTEISEHGLRAIQALSAYAPAARAVACSHAFFAQLSELVTVGSIGLQQLAASLISSLSPSEEIKRSMAGCMPAMVKMMELPKPASAQEVAAGALVCLLSARSNRVEMGKDAKSMTKIVGMLDPKREEICKRFPVSVVAALAASGGCRKRLSELGACPQLQRLVDGDVAGARRALKLIAGSRLKNLFSLSWRE